MSNLEDFLFSPIPQVKDLAERGIRYKKLFEEKQISGPEYVELIGDLVELKHINEDMTQLEAIREFWQVVDILKTMKFFATLI